MNHIAYCIGKNYSQHFCVSLNSLAQHNSKFHLWLVHDGIGEKERAFIQKLSAVHQFAFHDLPISAETFSQLKIANHITNASYYRLLLPELLAEKTERVLYLDADIVVRSNLDELFGIDLKGTFLAAVEDAVYKGQELPHMEKDTPYFNSGVMLIDLRMWRKHSIKDRVVSEISINPDKFLYLDQCALNAVINGRWQPVYPKFNLQTHHFEKQSVNITYSDDAIVSAINRPAIIHYTVSSKPWFYLNRHPYKSLYLEHLEQTPFAGVKPHDRNFKNFIRKQFPAGLKRTLNKLRKLQA